MSNLELSKTYLKSFFRGDLNHLSELIVEDLRFQGPFVDTASAKEYVATLTGNLQPDTKYEILHEFENNGKVCLVYNMIKPNGNLLVSQVFEFRESKISQILTVFDSKGVLR